MRRRSAVLGAAAVAALAAGSGTAWWRSRSAPSIAAAPPTSTWTSTQDVWSLAFDTLDGTALPMAPFRGRPLLLNFWATWCAPCVTEMPLLDAFAHDAAHARWQVLALAVDRRDPVATFVGVHRLRLGVALAGATGLDLARSLGNGVGALPFTAVFDSHGVLVERKIGAVTPELLLTWSTAVT